MSLRNTIGRTANLVEVRAPGSQGAAGATWRGTWAAGVTYNQNDLVRYLANGNLYFHSNATASLSADPSNLPTNTSNWDLFASIQDAEKWSNEIRHSLFTNAGGTVTGYSALHGSLQSKDWASKITGFVSKDTKSETAAGIPSIAANVITFEKAHGFTVTSPFTAIRFRVIRNSDYASTVTLPAGLTAGAVTDATDGSIQSAVFYVKTVPATTTMTLSATDSGGTLTVSGGTGTLTISDELSAKAWSVGGTEVTTTAGRGAAKEWATTTSGAVDTVDHSAKAWAIGGTGITDTAAHGSSKEWAIETSGNVDGTSYSAKEYAQGTQASTGGSAKNWATQTAADVTGASSGDMSSKEWALGTLGRGQSGEGSAKDWATYTAGTVDNAGYSAKYWADTAATTYDSFDDRYLGAKSSDPSVDNDGATLIDGALYFNTSANNLRVYDLGNTTWIAIALPFTTGKAIAMAIVFGS